MEPGAFVSEGYPGSVGFRHIPEVCSRQHLES